MLTIHLTQNTTVQFNQRIEGPGVRQWGRSRRATMIRLGPLPFETKRINMKALYLNQKGGAESLLLGELPAPQPGPGEVLVKVHATAVTPTEFEWFPTFNTPAGTPRPFPIVLGHELAGEVAALGPEVSGFAVGDLVHGLNDWFANGAAAEYCVAPVTALARRPRLLNSVQAAVMPISALTAWQALFEKTKLQSGERILIHGGAGGVGLFAVQLARWRRARVIATASAANRDFVHAIGAHEVIDYRTAPFESAVRNVDVVLDTVGGDTLARSWNVLAPGGRLVTIASSSARAENSRDREAFLLVRADGPQLEQIGQLVDAGEVSSFVGGFYPLAEARTAFERARQGGLRGKIALRVAA